MKKPCILIADDHQIFLEGLKQLLVDQFNLVGSATNGRELLNLGRKLKPDVIITDIDMPEMTGLEAVSTLKQEGLSPKVIFLTMLGDTKTVVDAFRVGGSGYIMKYSAVTELVSAMHEVLAGRVYITPRIAKDMLDICLHPKSRGPDLPITSRQAEVLRLIARGKTMKEVAAILAISKRTAETHKYQMMEHLGVKTVAELIQFGMSAHIVATPAFPATPANRRTHAVEQN